MQGLRIIYQSSNSRRIESSSALSQKFVARKSARVWDKSLRLTFFTQQKKKKKKNFSSGSEIDQNKSITVTK
jgi:hypothetical protein